MPIENGTPRRKVESDPVAQIMGLITSLRSRVESLERGGHTHAGEQITTAVPNATNALGSQTAFNGTVSGTSSYAVWVGNDAGYTLGRSTSSARYKKNIEAHDSRARDVLQLQPVIYDRNDVLGYPEDPETGERLIGPPNLIQRGTKGEYGLIAEQVAENVPEIIQWYEGEIDGIRYDLLSVALLDVVKVQNARIRALEQAMLAVKPDFTGAARRRVRPRRRASAAPEVAPAPTPYTIATPEGELE